MNMRRSVFSGLAAFLCGALGAQAFNSSNLLLNGGVTRYGTDDQPWAWGLWGSQYSDPEFASYASSPNSWAFWHEAGIWQDAVTDFRPGDKLAIDGYLTSPVWDPLRNGSKAGVMEVEFWNANALVSTVRAQPTINATNSVPVTNGYVSIPWVNSKMVVTVPSNASAARVVVHCVNYLSGDGRFFADELFAFNVNGDINLLAGRFLDATTNPAIPPQGWTASGAAQGAEYARTVSPGGAWRMWDSGALYQQVGAALKPGENVRFGVFAMTPSNDPLRSGLKSGKATLQLYNGTSLVASASSPAIAASNAADRWVFLQGALTAPSAATAARLVLSCDNGSSGSGTVIFDNPFLAGSRSDVIDNYGAPTLALVGGKPAAAYVADGYVCFAINSATNGTGVWNTMNVAPVSYMSGRPSLAVVNGKPAIAFAYGYYNPYLYIAVSSTADGLGTWAVYPVYPKSPSGPGYADIRNPHLSVANGKPMISFHNDQNQNCGRYDCAYFGIWVAQCGSVSGTTNWDYTSYVARSDDTNDVMDNGSAVTIGGRSMFAYTCTGNVYLTVSQTTNLFPQTTYLIDTGAVQGFVSLASVGSQPAIAYSAAAGLKYAFSTNVDVAGAWTIKTIEAGLTGVGQLAVVSNRPSIAYCVPASQQIKLATAGNAAGSGAWSNRVVASGTATHGLINLGNKSAIAYSVTGATEQLRFVVPQ